MSETHSREDVRAASGGPVPFRLHHFNFSCRDHEQTRAFYEDLLGIPLIAFWCEVENDVIMGHAFYGLADGSSLAFMHHAQAAIREPILAVETPGTIHLALHVTADVQDETVRKLRAAGHKVMEIDHGFVKSIYFRDPNNLLVEYTVNPPNFDEIWGEQKAGLAYDNLRQYIGGDYTKTNKWYPEGHQKMEFR